MNILLVDGYNIIGDWEELKRLRDKDMAELEICLLNGWQTIKLTQIQSHYCL